ncbi:MAG: DNA-protecting protein DprA [Candidatus Komeilibacteria bacterium CG_4_10_14_0_2_um_filter_37_10]|uniref:DNA-protecting protein DprA n=1 Tax=Candidatus Komeilibacteria bacterium CG_4_10_14_0_2_um_filter_37_10 TaxID=1974470 RepID=A0A2M7VGN2_9BACT|nr:MAG: DNA-protecting protein DprA [Candidatus Komeilibacteria bacterium CG_4_10_14_0_2_um_filter_37_10]
MEQRVILLALSLLPQIGPRTILWLIKNQYLSESIFLSHRYPEFWPNKLKNIDWPTLVSNTKLLLEQLNKYQINYLTILDDNYPSLLKEIYDPPAVLYWRGQMSVFDHKNFLAVVGTRNCTNYAQQIMPALLKPVIQQNIIIVSGLALGVDGLAHQNALDQNAPTIAILAGGLDNASLYPRQNYHLAQKILTTGLLLSEYPPLTSCLPQNFPRRNRIIAGLSQATLIIEAANKSGSLITAQCALEQNREVMAVPGNIYQQQSQGTNKLIQQGAKLVCSSEDILETYKLTTGKTVTLPLLSNQEKIIIEFLQSTPLTIDKLSELCKMDIVTLSSSLSLLELKGLIYNQGSFIYLRSL